MVLTPPARTVAAKASARRWAGVRASSDQSASSPWAAFSLLPVGGQFGLHETVQHLSDASALGGGETGVQVPHVTDPPPRRRAGVVDVVTVTMGTVGVSETFPPADDPTEVLEADGRGDGDHRLGHRVELAAATPIGANPAQLAELSHPQAGPTPSPAATAANG